MSVYVNRVRIRFSDDEFFADLAIEGPEGPSSIQVVAPLVFQPPMAKLLLRRLEKAVLLYEAEHGDIPEPDRLIRPGQPKLSGVN